MFSCMFLNIPYLHICTFYVDDIVDFHVKSDEKIFYCGFIINFTYGISSICGSIC